MTAKARIVLFTVDDLEFVPELLDPVIAKWGALIVKAYVSRSLFDFRFFRKRLVSLLRSGYPFCIRFGDMLRFLGMKLNGARHGRGARTMVEYLRKSGIDAEYITEIHSDRTLGQLVGLDADIFLFAAFDKIAPTKLLSIPRVGTFNTHMGKLPEHRGALSAFWVLRFGDAEAGVSVHRAVEELDAGEIVAETRFPVATNSMFTLMHTTFGIGATTINTAMKRLIDGGWKPIDTTGRTSGYYRIPEGSDFKAFYERGCRLI